MNMNTSMKLKTPTLSFYKRNEDGTGKVLLISLHPAYGTQCGFFRAMIAQQAGLTKEDGWDWNTSVSMNLGANDIIQILAVLNGKKMRLQNGMIESTNGKNSFRLCLDACEDSDEAYLLRIGNTRGGADFAQGIWLSEAEGDGLRAVFEGCLWQVAFGK